MRYLSKNEFEGGKALMKEITDEEATEVLLFSNALTMSCIQILFLKWQGISLESRNKPNWLLCRATCCQRCICINLFQKGMTDVLTSWQIYLSKVQFSGQGGYSPSFDFQMKAALLQKVLETLKRWQTST